MRSVLIDTGPLVALLNRREARHRDCHDLFKSQSPRWITSEAVLTESLHFLPTLEYKLMALELVHSGVVKMLPTGLEGLERISALMRRYADVPMDYADATLVDLADQMDVDEVFTLDRRGFHTYLVRGKKPFRLLP
ncbi:MAG TPA: PIN domain-containing protein [Candidatus Xenobia bacterium]